MCDVYFCRVAGCQGRAVAFCEGSPIGDSRNQKFHKSFGFCIEHLGDDGTCPVCGIGLDFTLIDEFENLPYPSGEEFWNLTAEGLDEEPRRALVTILRSYLVSCFESREDTEI